MKSRWFPLDSACFSQRFRSLTPRDTIRGSSCPRSLALSVPAAWPDSPVILGTKVGIRNGSLFEGAVSAVGLSCTRVETPGGSSLGMDGSGRRPFQTETRQLFQCLGATRSAGTTTTSRIGEAGDSQRRDDSLRSSDLSLDPAATASARRTILLVVISLYSFRLTINAQRRTADSRAETRRRGIAVSAASSAP